MDGKFLHHRLHLDDGSGRGPCATTFARGGHDCCQFRARRIASSAWVLMALCYVARQRSSRNRTPKRANFRVLKRGPRMIRGPRRGETLGSCQRGQDVVGIQKGLWDRPPLLASSQHHASLSHNSSNPCPVQYRPRPQTHEGDHGQSPTSHLGGNGGSNLGSGCRRGIAMVIDPRPVSAEKQVAFPVF